MKRRISNQSDDNLKYHTDIYNTKSKYESDFDPTTFNKMSIGDQLEFTIARFPIGSKVYTNLNCAPTECTVLGYVINCDICCVLTDYNEIKQGYNWEHYGNTSMHPAWFYAASSFIPTNVDVFDYSDHISYCTTLIETNKDSKQTLLGRILKFITNL